MPYGTRAEAPVKVPGRSRPVPYLGRLVDFVEPASDDVCLDVAHGGGPLAAALASRVRVATSADIAAPRRTTEGRAPTVLFRPGTGRHDTDTITVRADPSALPYQDGSFSLVTCRSSINRLADRTGALREMLRVCRPGGRLIIADLVRTRHTAPERERLELLRDPDHRGTPSVALLTELITGVGADLRRLDVFSIERPIDPWLADSPDPSAADRIRDALLTEIDGGPCTGARPRLIGGELWFTQAWAYLAAQPVR